MSAETRNEFLDADNSDDDIGRNSDSEDDFQKGGRSAKRRRVDENEDSDASDHSDDERDDKDNNTNKNKNTNGKDEAETSSAKKGEEPASLDDPGPNSFPKQKKPSLPKLELNLAKPLHKKNLIVTEAAIKKSGVIYLSRVPPFMKPQKLRSLLEPYGQINRIFLAPEDPAEHARRVRAGGNKKRSYSEGWVEFVKKKDAKKVVDLLNAQTIGGKKSSWYRDDVWSLKYLSGFKWHHLTEQIAAENAERQSRMRAEISKSTKENKEFVKNVEKAKVLNGIEAKKAAKRKKADVDEGQGGGGAEAKEETVDREAKGPQKRRTFAQVPTVKKRKTEEQQPDQVQRVLSKIF